MTITDPERLIAEIEVSRRDGFAHACEETLLGVNSVGAPVRDARNQIIASLSAAFPMHARPDPRSSPWPRS
ncbi:IclR family transcriptional regulator domain-containing protein [Frigidibacter sp. MR17.24]|uniref:IclR family transcriptional regulator domain-containing protein n=1 Tax=Frigidibacter sp. MR17.24 TaxID=3127345 RepID=UPI003012B4D5